MGMIGTNGTPNNHCDRPFVGGGRPAAFGFAALRIRARRAHSGQPPQPPTTTPPGDGGGDPPSPAS